MSQLFAWGGQSIGVSASASVLPMNTQDWSPSEWTCWTSLQSKGLSRVFSNTSNISMVHLSQLVNQCKPSSLGDGLLKSPGHRTQVKPDSFLEAPQQTPHLCTYAPQNHHLSSPKSMSQLEGVIKLPLLPCPVTTLFLGHHWIKRGEIQIPLPISWGW